MANDKTKIIREAVDVYIAETGESTNSGNESAWTLLGWCGGGSIKLSPQNRNEIDLHDDSKFRLSTDFLFEAMGLETTSAQITALEAFEDLDVDILLVTRADRAECRKLAGMTFIIEPDFVFSEKTPKKIKVEATVTAANLSAFYSEVTVTGTF